MTTGFPNGLLDDPWSKGCEINPNHPSCKPRFKQPTLHHQFQTSPSTSQIQAQYDNSFRVSQSQSVKEEPQTQYDTSHSANSYPPNGTRGQNVHNHLAYPSPSSPTLGGRQETDLSKKKAGRTSNACDACRATKSKCDDPKPCSSCRNQVKECKWKTSEKRPDPAQIEIMKRLEALSKEVKSQNAKVGKAFIKLDKKLGADLHSEDSDKEEEPAIPAAHTTRAVGLLLWPAVENFMCDISYKVTDMELFIEYPYTQEEKHGLTLYGQARARRADADGQLELDEVTVSQLLQSYLDHIHIMHPILDPAQLRTDAGEFTGQLPPGKKRKRSALPQRSSRSAVLLLVFALGEICMHRGKIPDFLLDKEITESPPQSEDMIPGLVYAAAANDILGNKIGENTLHYVHANILASLYFGQLTRPMCSYFFLNHASTGLHIILQMKVDHFREYKRSQKPVPADDNPVMFAFWTCLQLESDIITELELPRLGITTLEAHMPWPNLAAAKEAGQINVVEAESYQAQIYFRNFNRQIGKSLEEDYELPIDPQASFPIIQTVSESFPNINLVAPSMVWSESDPPANYILHARLRATYYSTKVKAYRRFLKMVMGRPSWMRHLKNINPEFMDYAQLCIQALEKSTTAFHGITGGRPIITDIWATAHTQWGNAILLQAAYQDSLLQKFIDKDKLQTLVMKTLEFLRVVADPASALMIDLRILECAASKMGFLKER